MSKFVPVSRDELLRARTDPRFRQRLLRQNMEVLLEGLKRARKSSNAPGLGAESIKEGAQLAVRLAEIIQAPPKAQFGPSALLLPGRHAYKAAFRSTPAGD